MYEILLLASRGEHKLSVVENRALRNIFGPAERSDRRVGKMP
jgi:hypothetical protein